MERFPIRAVVVIFILVLVSVWGVVKLYNYANPPTVEQEFTEEDWDELVIPLEGTENYDRKRHKTPGEIILENLRK